MRLAAHGLPAAIRRALPLSLQDLAGSKSATFLVMTCRPWRWAAGDQPITDR